MNRMRCLCLAVLVAKLAGAGSTNETADGGAKTDPSVPVEIPLLDIRIESCQPFNPVDPEVNVVYTNLSANYAISVITPGQLDRLTVCPTVWFDNVLARYLFDDNKEPPMPRSFALVEPSSSLAVRYRLSDAVTVPPNWGTVTVHESHQQLLVDRDYSFDRSGRLVGVTIRRQRDLARLRAEILESKPARRMLELLYRPSATGSNRLEPASIQEPGGKETKKSAAGAIETSTETNAAHPPAPPGSAQAAPRETEDEWRDAHVPVVECTVRTPRGFDAADPVVVVTYSNTSDRCSVFEPVPTSEGERLEIGPAVRFDGEYATARTPTSDRLADVLVEIPPSTMIAQVYRVGDKWLVPKAWTRMRVEPVSGYAIRNLWFEFDRTGRATGNGVRWERSYGEYLSNEWRVVSFREKLRARMRDFVAERASGSTGVVPRFVRGVPVSAGGATTTAAFIVDNVVHVRRERVAETNAVGQKELPRQRP